MDLIMTEQETALYAEGFWNTTNIYLDLVERAGRLAPPDEPVIVYTIEGAMAFALTPSR